MASMLLNVKEVHNNPFWQ